MTYIKQTANESKNVIRRNATNAEQLTLKEVLTHLPIPQKRYLKATLNTAVFWTFLLAGLCILWFVGGLLVSSLFNSDLGISSAYAPYIFPILIVSAAFFAINSTRTWLNSSVNEYAMIEADIASKITVIETYQVIKAKSFQEPKLGGLVYFLLLQEPGSQQQKIRVIYDYESQNEQADPKKLLKIKQQIIFYSAATSQYLFKHKFHGYNIEAIEKYELTLSPDQWPEPNSWQESDWDSLALLYNPQ